MLIRYARWIVGVLVVAAWLWMPIWTWAGGMPEEVLNDFQKAHPGHAPESLPQIKKQEPEVLERVTKARAGVALTFDACSTWEASGYDPRVIELLRQTETPATLFLGGLWMLRHQEVTQELHKDPLFELGNHSYSHPDLTHNDPSDISRELGYTQLIAYELTGETPVYFRPPHVKKDDKVVEIAGKWGMVTVQYDIASGDADAEACPEEIADYVVGTARPGSIVVLHMNNPDLPTAKALPRIILGLQLRGLEPVTVCELHVNE